ncbi:nicotinate-nucleotide adenylyltransferase [Labilibacter sediminis]|nr:nicotinate-nucleotide adenylyltransferase [Labilibacter sediminis]
MHSSANNIGLFFGSFNPVHVGHLALANYIVENSDIDEIWFVVSPQNPFKQTSDLIEARHRIKMLELSTQRYCKFKVEDIETNLPTPSYTYNTLRELRKANEDKDFTIIMGSDNLLYLNRWKNIAEILEHTSVLVYPRPNYPINSEELTGNTKIIEAPVFNIDSTSIRKGLKNGMNYCFLIPKEAHEYIEQNHLYQ